MAKQSVEFMQAVAFGNIDKVKELIAAGAPVNDAGGWGHSYLADAAERGRTEIVNLLLDAGAEIEALDKFNNTPLVHAAEGGHLNAVRALMARGANVNHQGKLYTALSRAASGKTKAYLECVKALLAAGADVERGAIPPLTQACGSSSLDVVRTLIAAGAVVNRVTDRGSPLTEATDGNRPEIVAVLLAAGADPALRLPDDFYDTEFAGKSALDIAKKKKAKKILAMLESPGKPEGTPEKAPGVAASWKKIDAWLKKHNPALRKRLNPGATEEQLNQVEVAIGLKFPADFAQAYRIHNGNQSGAEDLIPPPEPNEAGYYLLGTDEIVTEWRSWKQLLDGGEFAGQESGPDRGIRGDSWWHPGWIPFASNGGGDSICLDLAPTPEGTIGQIITMSHETSERKLLASCFAQWLADVAESLEDAKAE